MRKAAPQKGQKRREAELSKNEPNQMMDEMIKQMIAEMRKENAEIKQMIAEMRKENAEIKQMIAEMRKENADSLYKNLKEFFSRDRNFYFLIVVVGIILTFYGWMGWSNQMRAKNAYDLITKDRGLAPKVESGWWGFRVEANPVLAHVPLHVPASKADVEAKGDIPPAPTPEPTAHGSVPTPPDGGLIPTASCDAAEPWQLGSQDAATPMMQGIIDLHHDIFFFLILILVFVSRVLVRALWHFHYQKNPIPQRIVHGTTIEIIRTIFPSIIPMFIAIPSFALLYSMDEVVVDPSITIKAIGHQWYRTYEYSDYNSSDEQSLTFDSYTIPEDDPELGQSRLLEVDNRVVVPAKTHLRIIVTSADVLHSWAVPSSGVKCDAVPGRLNQTSISVQREGVYYGQCSEICGTNHAFTPIVVEAVPRKDYGSRFFLTNNSLWDKIKANLDKDTMAVNLIDLVKKGKTRQFWLQDGLLMSKGNRVFVPKAGDLRRTLLRECHDTLWAGHPGEERTLALLKQGYYWPQMCDDVVEYVRTCLICQQDKPEHKKKAGLLEPLPVPKRPWESVSLDYITSLPKVGDIGTIVTMVDRFSKYATFVAAPKYISAEETAQLFFKHIVKYWGVPKSLVSDRDSRFMGNFWTELFKLLGTSLDMSSSYHPESDGQTERFNYMRQEYLRHFVNANQKNWVELLDVAQLCFNSQRSSSTGKSPFEIVTGQQPLLPHTVEGPYEGKSPRAFQFAREWKRNHDLVRAYLEKAASKMKKWADEHRRPLEFKAGDQVLVKLKSDERKYLRGRDKRLVRKYEGPVTIIKKIGKCAYKIDAPSWLKVHPVFHVSLLKPYNPDKEDPSRNESQRQPITVKAGKKSVECILADRVKKVSRKQQRQYLVKWKGLGDDEISWEREADLTAFKEEIEAYWAKLPRTSTVQVGEGVTGHP
ncbi:hypothetical protein RHSIM_RhsimMtG0001900 (mitochondrion) [Rhododendron simsii]|uniref:cytochrome-c oxidase n=1 Tax=Rhododendron simsii TaxID=118357 RepID=A0A834L5Y7_RHOSS|nr:hypothetical protein RHSIM_RhsimMtG0001900 [Rhododendron simsii]